MTDFEIYPTDALLVIDILNDFLPLGALAVERGDEIIPGVNRLAKRFHEIGAPIVLAQDWHPEDSSSFAKNNDAAPFSVIQLPYGQQTMWPQHCVQKSMGAQFAAALRPTEQMASLIIRKGMNPKVDSHSAFFENDKTTRTGLGGYLLDKSIARVFCVGLAYDFCVAYSARDAAQLGFKTFVIKDLTRAINLPLEQNVTTVSEAEASFKAFGVEVI